MATTIRAFEDEIMNDHRTEGIAIFVFELDKYRNFIDKIPLDNIPTADVRVQTLPKPLHGITKYLACIDNEGEHFVQNVDAMRAEVFAVLDAFKEKKVRSVAMSGIKVKEIPDKTSRPEAYQRQYVEEYVASHPDAFDTICLLDLHGGFNRCRANYSVFFKKRPNIGELNMCQVIHIRERAVRRRKNIQLVQENEKFILLQSEGTAVEIIRNELNIINNQLRNNQQQDNNQSFQIVIGDDIKKIYKEWIRIFKEYSFIDTVIWERKKWRDRPEQKILLYSRQSEGDLSIRGVTAIEADVFSGRNQITSIEISDEVTKIGDRAFSGCTMVNSVEINGSPIIGRKAFEGCGCAVMNNNSLLYYHPVNNGTVFIPENVTEIADNAFAECEQLIHLQIPGNVTKIGWYAFADCRSLVDVIIAPSENGASQTIEGCAFSGCVNLESIVIPNNVTSIGNAAFEGCSSLQNVRRTTEGTRDNDNMLPAKLIEIGDYAFADCNHLTIAMIPQVKKIGIDAFRNCSISVKNLPARGNGTTVREKAYEKRFDLINVRIHSRVTSIGKKAFHNCKNMIEVTIPSSVKTIDSEAFRGCVRLEKVIFENDSKLETIGDAAFSECASLICFGSDEPRGKANIPANVTKIGWGTFSGCTGLKTIEFLGDNIPEMGYGAFFCCTNLAIPSNLAEGNRNAFRGCAIQSNDTRDDKLTEIGSLFKTNEIFKSERIVGIIREWMNTSYDWKGKDELFTTLEFNKYSQELREAIDQNRWQLLNEGEIKKKIRIAVENILEWGGINQDDGNADSFVRPMYNAGENWNPLKDTDTIEKVSSWSKIYAAYKPGEKFIYDSRVALSLSYISLQIDAPCFWRIPSSRGVNDPEWKQFKNMCQRNRILHSQNNTNVSENEADIPTCYNQYLELLNALARNKGIIEGYRKLDERIRQAYKAIDYDEHQAIMAHLEKVLFMKKDDILAPFKPAEERNIEQNDQDPEEEESEYPE